LLLLALLPFAVHLPQVLLPFHTDPLWIYGGVAAGSRLGILPGHPFLDPNVGFTTQALGGLAAWDWLRGIIPWWNPYVGIGVPLAGQMVPGAFFLPFVLLLALPGGVLWLTIAMQILAGMFAYALLLELRLNRLAALTGGALFALNGTIAWVPGPASVFCPLPFLPLLLWGIERAATADRRSIAAIAAAIAWSILAGFPETAYIDGLLALCWAVLRFAQATQRAPFALRVGAGGVLGLCLAAPLLIAFADDIAASNVMAQHLFTEDAFLSLRALPAMLMPTIYGPPNAWLEDSSVWGNLGGYSSPLILLFAIAGAAMRGPDRGLRALLAGWAVLALLRVFAIQPGLSLVQLLPAMSKIVFYRYAAPSWAFCLVVLAAYGLDRLRRPGAARTLAVPMVLVFAGLAAAAALGWPVGSDGHARSRFVWLGVSAAWACAGLAFLAWACKRLQKRALRHAAAGLLVLDASAEFALPQFAGDRGGRLDLPLVHFLHDHLGLDRFATIGPLWPNYAAYFRIAGINHNVLPTPGLWVERVNTRLFPGYAGGDFGTVFWPVRPPPFDAQGATDALDRHAADYRDLGVRYVLTPPGQGLQHSVTLPTPAGLNSPLPLRAGETAVIAARAPASVTRLTGIGFFLGTYGGAADGSMSATLCAAADCRTGTLTLAHALDNDFLSLPLDPPLPLAAGTDLRISLAHEGGTNPVALWLWPPVPGAARLIEGPPGAPASAALPLSFQTGAAAGLRVFRGEAANVWALPDPAPYFDSAPAGACALSFRTRSSVTASCLRSATLIRRELFMSGWRVLVNGRPATVAPYDDALQGVALRAGQSTASFDFAPPYVAYGWLASGAAALVLASLWRTVGRRQKDLSAD
jgi:hypothetical protein